MNLLDLALEQKAIKLAGSEYKRSVDWEKAHQLALSQLNNRLEVFESLANNNFISQQKYIEIANSIQSLYKDYTTTHSIFIENEFMKRLLTNKK